MKAIEGGGFNALIGKCKKMPSILLSAAYVLIGNKKCYFCALFLIFLNAKLFKNKAQTRSFLHFFVVY